MGAKFVIAGADFSALNLGRIPTGQEFIDAVSAADAGFAASVTQKNAIYSLVDDLVAAGIWDKFTDIWPFVGLTANSQKFNLKDPRDLDAAGRIVFAGAGTFSALGYNGGGVSGVGNTFRKPSSITGKHLAFYNTGSAAATGAPMGFLANTAAGGTQMWLSRNFGGSTTSTFGGAMAVAGYDLTKKGLLLGQVKDGFHKAYDNGVEIASNSIGILVDNTPNTNTLKIGAIPNATGVSAYFTNMPIGFASLGDALTPSEITAFAAAVLSFQTTLGRA